MSASPFDIENPASPHGLLMRRRFGKPLDPSDLIPVFEANSEVLVDGEFRALMLDILAGETAPKRGRPKKQIGDIAKLICAEMYIEDRANEIRAERRKRPNGQRIVKGEMSPTQQAAGEVAWQFHITGKALLNKISAMKKGALFAGMNSSVQMINRAAPQARSSYGKPLPD